MSKKKAPDTQMRVLYVTTAGRKIVRVKPKGNTVTIGNETFKVTQSHIFPGKGDFDAICRSGVAEAVPVYKRAPVSAEDYDDALNSNLLSEVYAMGRGPKIHNTQWVIIGGLVVVVLVQIIAAIIIHGAIEDLGVAIAQAFEQQQQAPRDGTRVGG